MKKTTKIIAMVMVLAMMLGFCACGKNEFSFSDGLDENGYFKGIKALDYYELGDFSKIVIQQKQIDAEIEYLTTELFPEQVKVTDRAVEAGDTYNMGYVGKIDGVAFENGSTGEGGATVNTKTDKYIDGFFDQIVGHVPGETFDINVTFPDPYENNKDLSGKAAVFTITLNYIVEYKKAEWTDDFVYNNMYYYYGLKTTAEAEDYIKNMLLDDFVGKNAKLTGELPEAVQTWYEKCVIKNLENQAKNQMGVELVKLLKDQYGVNSETEFIEKYKDELSAQAQSYLLLQALAENEGYKASEAEIQEMLKTQAEKEEDQKAMIDAYGMPYLAQFTMQNKVYEKLMEKVVIE